VAQYPPDVFKGKVSGLIASPPCQDFSHAGKRAGRTGEKGQLIDTVPVWVEALRPEWVACEQVPPALPVWREHAEGYRRLGYAVWTGTLNAADYGVPQTRQRAFLLATQSGSPLPAPPTHSNDPHPGLFGVLETWVSMADALGWRDALVGFPRLADTPSNQATGVVTLNGQDYRERDLYPTAGPAQTVTEKARSWTLHRPATTVMGDPRIAKPGHTGNEGKERSMTGAIRVTIEEASVLQSFRRDYPWQGSRTKQFEQCGNAVPPLLAARVIGALAGVELAVAA
jgi:DNA (cytosine-5)-methyltransferase 1